MIYVDFPDGVKYRRKTVAKIVVFGRFYSKNRGKSIYTVARKIRSFKRCFCWGSGVNVYSLVALNRAIKKRVTLKRITLYKVLDFS